MVAPPFRKLLPRPGVPGSLQVPQSSLASEPGPDRPFPDLHFQQPRDPPPPWRVSRPLGPDTSRADLLLPTNLVFVGAPHPLHRVDLNLSSAGCPLIPAPATLPWISLPSPSCLIAKSPRWPSTPGPRLTAVHYCTAAVIVRHKLLMGSLLPTSDIKTIGWHPRPALSGPPPSAGHVPRCPHSTPMLICFPYDGLPMSALPSCLHPGTM